MMWSQAVLAVLVVKLRPILVNDEIEAGVERKDTADSLPPLGEPRDEKKFWFQREEDCDTNAIATQPSMYDVPNVGDKYVPRAAWSKSLQLPGEVGQV